MAFYEYRQNNSGGSFVIDMDLGITVHVIVEADSAKEADERAERIGLYFDGYGDCDCCGDRWYSQGDGWLGDSTGDSEPMIYSTPIEEHYALPPQFGVRWTEDDEYDAIVHYKDGTTKGYQYPAVIDKEVC